MSCNVLLLYSVHWLVTNVIYSIRTTHRNWKFRIVDIMAIEKLMHFSIVIFQETDEQNNFIG